MKLVLLALGIISLLELLLWLPPVWRWRKPLACGLIVALAISSGLLAGAHFAVWALIILYFSLYRLINLLRLVEGRSDPQDLYRVTRHSSHWLIGCQLIVVGLASISHAKQWFGLDWLAVLCVGQLLVAAVLFGSTWRHLRTTRPPSVVGSQADRDLPTLTIAIPARNETTDLEACLQSLVASTYPKLEILVLDDCSQNRHTAAIIRSFAQDGVRFIAGQSPPDNWLAKNYAYEQLVDEANGELMLFCGVDTRFAADSLRAMVEILLQKQKTMVSVIPRNQLPSRWSWTALLVQPGRYVWELSLPRRLLNRPPVLSTCWLITTEALHSAGGMQAVSRNSVPENYFAHYAARHGDGYSFLQSDSAIGLASTKSIAEQQATAIRTRYPQVHRRPELVGLLSLAELITLVAPFALVVSSTIEHFWGLAVISLVTCGLLTIFFARIVDMTYRRFLLRGLWLLPLAALYDIGLLNYSMWQYEFRQVIWKGRNICLPIVQMATKLPNISK